MTQPLALFGETQKTVGEWQENGDERFLPKHSPTCHSERSEESVK